MIPLIIAGIVGAGIGAVVALNWDEIKSWLLNVICKVKELWQKYKPYAKKVASIVAEKYIKNGHPMVRIMYRLFFKMKIHINGMSCKIYLLVKLKLMNYHFFYKQN